MSQKLSLPSKDFEDAVGAIIERDFYPDLPLLRQQLHWLEAINSGDADRIALARQHVSTSIRRAESLVGASAAPTTLIPNNCGGADVEESGKVSSSSSSSSSSRRRRRGEEGEEKEVRDRVGNASLKRRKNKSVDDDTSSLVSWTAGIQRENQVGQFDKSLQRVDYPTSVIDSSIAINSRIHHHDDEITNPSDALLDSLPLNGFLNTFESEDSTSFSLNMNKETGERMRSHWWAHAPVDSRKWQIMMTEGSSSRAAPTGPELLKFQQQRQQQQQQQQLSDTTGNTSQLAIVSNTAIDKMRDPHGLKRFWKHKPRNNLFFMPSEMTVDDAKKETESGLPSSSSSSSSSATSIFQNDDKDNRELNHTRNGIRKRETQIAIDSRRNILPPPPPPAPRLHRPGVGPGGYEYVDTPLFLQGISSPSRSQSNHQVTNDPSDEAITAALGLSTSSSSSTAAGLLSDSQRVFTISTERPRELLRNKLIDQMVTSSSTTNSSIRGTSSSRPVESITSRANPSRTPLFASAATPSLLQAKPITTGASLQTRSGRHDRDINNDGDGAASVHGSERTTRSNISSASTNRSQLDALPPAQRAIALRVAAATQQRRMGRRSGQSIGGDLSGIF
jgi:hypothetical protein